MIEFVTAGLTGIGILANLHGANQAETNSRRAANKAYQASAERLAFAKEQYDDWQEVYGPIQENLSSFYQNLDPDTFAASGVQQLEEQFIQVQEDFQRSYAQRGITTGAQALAEQSAALQLAQGKAEIRQKAPLQVASAQQGFLNQNASNPNVSGVTNALGQQANHFQGQASHFQGQAQQGYAAAGQGINSAISSYVQDQQFRQMQTARQYGTRAGSEQTRLLHNQDNY